MTPEEVRLILDAVQGGATPIERAVEQLTAGLGWIDLGTARIDTDRRRRRGFPEVIYCESKQPRDVARIARALLENGGLAFGTRCPRETAEFVLEEIGEGEYDPVSRTLRIGRSYPMRSSHVVAVLAAGTSDLPVAEEACVTLETFGVQVDRIWDVGVAGIHRLLDQRERIDRASVLIVAAGMEGALPSVVGGLFHQPLIAVPVSVGYGTALHGFTALFSMLTSCSSGITVVNIDNGFGAAMAALSIVTAIEEHATAGTTGERESS